MILEVESALIIEFYIVILAVLFPYNDIKAELVVES